MTDELFCTVKFSHSTFEVVKRPLRKINMGRNESFLEMVKEVQSSLVWENRTCTEHRTSNNVEVKVGRLLHPLPEGSLGLYAKREFCYCPRGY